jgi:hypothetical protein
LFGFILLSLFTVLYLIYRLVDGLPHHQYLLPSYAILMVLLIINVVFIFSFFLLLSLPAAVDQYHALVLSQSDFFIVTSPSWILSIFSHLISLLLSSISFSHCRHALIQCMVILLVIVILLVCRSSAYWYLSQSCSVHLYLSSFSALFCFSRS